MTDIYIKNSHIYYNSYTSAFYWSWFFPCALEKKERNGKQLQFTTDCLQQADSEVGVSVPVLQMKKLRLQGESCPRSQGARAGIASHSFPSFLDHMERTMTSRKHLCRTYSICDYF